MNEFFALSLFVSIFASHAFCMMPSNWKPPAPTDVIFGECFFVPGITGGGGLLDEIHYSYRHICRQNYPQDGPQPPEHRRNWYIVGTRQTVGAESVDLPSYNYAPIEQGPIKFVFLKGLTVKFVLRFTDTEFQITFQSLSQRKAFYGMVYRNVILSKATPNKIGVLHEVIIREDGNIDHSQKLGNDVEALCEGINNLWYITLKNEQGGPLLIFNEFRASITCLRNYRLINKQQLLLQAHGTFYILTFRSHREARKFSDALVRYVTPLLLNSLDSVMREYLRNNQITMDS